MGLFRTAILSQSFQILIQNGIVVCTTFTGYPSWYLAQEFFIEIANPATITMVIGTHIIPFHNLSIKGFIDLVTLLAQSQQTDLDDLIWTIVFKVKCSRDPALQTLIDLQEVVHLFRVTSKDNDDIAAVVLHKFEDFIQGFFPKIVI